MIGEALYREVVRSRPVGTDKFFSGCVCHVGNGRYHVEFVMYWNRGGMVGRMSLREVAAAAPDLVESLRHHSEELRAYLAAEDARREAEAGGLGSSKTTEAGYRTRDSAGVRECNGETRSDYARRRPWRAPMVTPDVDGSAGSGGVQVAQDGGFARDPRLTARNGEGGRG